MVLNLLQGIKYRILVVRIERWPDPPCGGDLPFMDAALLYGT
ncbi:MAG: hypothetical protein ACUVQ5_02625 [Candidatus Methanomethylicaceae archaeon]